MNNIRLTHYPKSDRKFPGVKTEVNGVELQQTTDIRLTCPVDALPKLEVTQFAYDGLDVELNGVVQPTVLLVDESFYLHVEHESPTKTRYWVTRKDSINSGEVRT